MKNSTNQTISEKLIEGMKNAMTEIEELRVQLALGKLEARDFFEDVKKSLRHKLAELKIELNILKDQPEVLKVIQAFESLQVQLALGIAETEDKFEEQRKKISLALHEFENTIKNNDSLKDEFNFMQLEIEKFKIKLELLALKFKLKKIGAEYNFEERKKDFYAKMDSARDTLLEKEKAVGEKWEHFQTEMTKAYTHLKKAFQSE